MGGDKHGSKSGRYVGGFLQLFDWNAKSRKKLFSSKSDLPEQPKQGKRSEGNLPMRRIHLADEEEYGAGLSIKGGSDYSCASSVTDDDGYGTKVPSVVARLMGLDSLPTSNILEPYSTPFYGTLSLRDVPYRGQNLDFYQDHQIMHSRHLLEKMESPPRNVLDTRSQKLPMPSRPIEKFQTETLPPKSAKTIPITHHKLLSPIKSPIFVPSQDAAHIMEAAAKIIEPGPQVTPRTRISSAGSSSVPFKVRELKEKLEATQRPLKAAEPSQRPVEANATKYLRGQPMNRSWNGSGDSTSINASTSRDDASTSGRSKGKSVSLAIQAKVNVQKREGLTTSNRSMGGTEEQDDSKSVQSSFKSQSNGPRITSKRSSIQNSSSVLRQNNQKQNCSTYRDKAVSKTSVSASTGKKAITEVTSHVRQKNLNRDAGTSKTVSRKSSLQERDNDKESTYWGVRNGPRKKRSLDGSLHFKNQVTDSMPVSKHEKPSHNTVVDRQFNWIEESRRKDMDVVSFTFTAPITRSLSGSEHSRQLAEKGINLCTDDRGKKVLSSDISKLSSSGFNLIGGDALSALLEQKLKELTSSLETSHNKYIKTDTLSASDSQNDGSAETETGKTREKKAQQELLSSDMNTQIYSELSLTEPEHLRRKCIFQEVEALDEYSSSKPQTKQWNDCHLPSPVSTLEACTLTESCYSSESIASSTEESKLCSSSVQAQEVCGSSSMQKLKTTGTQTDLSDSASSTSSQTRAAKDTMKSTAWELGYVKDLLCNVELMFKDYATGRTRDIVNPHLFDQLERRRGGGLRTGENESRLERKVLFDCVSECLDLKCQRFVGNGFKLWAKGIATVKRKERLAEEVYKEIQGWRSLGNSMVDELVDKDMSNKYGKWMDHEVDEFMVGVEIQGEILDSLVMEIVADIFPSNLSLSR